MNLTEKTCLLSNFTTVKKTASTGNCLFPFLFLTILLCFLCGCGKDTASDEMADAMKFDSSCPILGTWIREEDAFKNMVIEISKDDNGKISATLLYVPAEAIEYGFKVRDMKMKNIRCTSKEKCQYENESLCKGGVIEWSESLMRVVDGNVLLTHDKVYSERPVGNKQRWHRVRPGTTDMAYVAFGKGQIALEFEEVGKAKDYYQIAVRRRPDDTFFCNNLAWELATSKHYEIRNPKTAIRLATYACDETSYGNGINLDTLAAAYAADGSFDKAVSIQEKALDALGEYDSNRSDFKDRLRLYKQKKSYVRD